MGTRSGSATGRQSGKAGGSAKVSSIKSKLSGGKSIYYTRGGVKYRSVMETVMGGRKMIVTYSPSGARVGERRVRSSKTIDDFIDGIL